MPTPEALKIEIRQAITGFSSQQLAASAEVLFAAMGYRSQRSVARQTGRPEDFLARFDTQGKLNRAAALVPEWTAAQFLFQLTGDELHDDPQLRMEFEKVKKVESTIIESYIMIAIHLKGDGYSRTKLAAITREVNKLFGAPALVLFAYGEARTSLTLAVIQRRQHKRDESRDVLEKVTLIKDITVDQPHRAHVEILADLALPTLKTHRGFTNWLELHDAWLKTLDTSELNKRFFREVANWYFWALTRVKFPKGAGQNDAERNSVSIIRLLTRLIFVWFIKEKGLVPGDLFERRTVDSLLKFDDHKGSTYYKAILQNLFFATLNQEMNVSGQPASRMFRGKAKETSALNPHYMVHNLYRYRTLFRDPDAALNVFASVPFLNGGLFECLDKDLATEAASRPNVVRVDGFSDRPDNELKVPDELFFGDERIVDLNQVYGTANKTYKVRGLLNTLHRYKFTVDENTPIEEEVALDPELLGRVFENLLAAYNPETGVTARKQTGSFYTPREIVNYMVDEALIAYFNGQLPSVREVGAAGENGSVNSRLRQLFAYTDEQHQFLPTEVETLITAIDGLKILDPACGSGAFPMGILHRLVFLLRKLDPRNRRWKEQQVEKVNAVTDATVREKALDDIEDTFSRNELDYGRKLYLIENCIYGVDIQPIAVQIAKLRCFISLVVDQRIDDTRSNRGVRPLPNLETKFVSADTLIGVERPAQLVFRNPEIDKLEKDLANIRHEHFSARTLKRKRECRESDLKLRSAMGVLLEKNGWRKNAADQLAAWDPYDQNGRAKFFDPEWMFDVKRGFDVVIGNPPYGTDLSAAERLQLAELYPEAKKKIFDIYNFFMVAAVRLTGKAGILTFIVPPTWLNNKNSRPLRKLYLAAGLWKLNFVPERVFESAVVDSVIFFLHAFTTRTLVECYTASYKGGFFFEELTNSIRVDQLGEHMYLSRTPVSGDPVLRIIGAVRDCSTGRRLKDCVRNSNTEKLHGTILFT